MGPASPATGDRDMSLRCATFSVVAHCPRSGQLGLAISTALPAVGGLCCFVEAGVGAIATQSWVNPGLGLDGLAALRAGATATAALDLALAGDVEPQLRQIGLVDARGRSAAFTGSACTGWAGQITGAGYSVQGNMLTGEATLRAMAAAVEDTTPDLAERLMRALEAGQAAGGDFRGKQSAALRVHDTEPWPLVDLRVDEHPEPVAELRRIHDLAAVQLTPFVLALPRRNSPARPLSPAQREMLLAPPAARPAR